jgi:hypothetical protein
VNAAPGRSTGGRRSGSPSLPSDPAPTRPDRETPRGASKDAPDHEPRRGAGRSRKLARRHGSRPAAVAGGWGRGYRSRVRAALDSLPVVGTAPTRRRFRPAQPLRLEGRGSGREWIGPEALHANTGHSAAARTAPGSGLPGSRLLARGGQLLSVDALGSGAEPERDRPPEPLCPGSPGTAPALNRAPNEPAIRPRRLVSKSRARV